MTMGAAPPVREIAADLGFTEGPVWRPDGTLVVTSLSRGLLYEITPTTGERRVFAEVGGGPNGLAQGKDGRIWVAQNGGKVGPSRSVRPVAPGVQVAAFEQVTDVLADGFDAPNDCGFAPDGRLWFTDPGPPLDDSTVGRVCAYDVERSEVEVLLDDVRYPNGFAFGADSDDFFLAETHTRRILRYRVVGGQLRDRRVFAEIPNGAPDGLAVDKEGRVYVATAMGDSVVVLDPSGSVCATLDLGSPSLVTNLCFGGPDFATLFVTAAKGGRVLAIEGDFPGAPPDPWLHS